MKKKQRPEGSILERFGRYLLLDHVVDGGMAKICRARFIGEQADKIVAIKMIQPQYSQDENFKSMFMDEIKVTFGLIHPNIAQTYDYGIQDGQLYTAMEYVDGKNLKQYLEKLKQRNFVFPVEISVYIISQVCQGLHYAHTFTDKLSGKKANIVHRDISPHNIMLTYDGAVKVIDFGIAKAETNSDATQAGTIKGKLSYLAPEYLEGKDLDPRYDEFAVGITLWEMLCSRKLFRASNDLAVLKEIQACKVQAPSTINPNVPEELDEIVLKCLSKTPDQRYENLDQLNRALVKFLYTTYPEFNSSDLSYFAHDLFKEDIEVDKKRFVEFGQIDISSYIEELKETEKTSTKASNAPSVSIKRKSLPEKTKESKRTKSAPKSKLDEKPLQLAQSLPSNNFDKAGGTRTAFTTKTVLHQEEKEILRNENQAWPKRIALSLMIAAGIGYMTMENVEKQKKQAILNPPALNVEQPNVENNPNRDLAEITDSKNDENAKLEIDYPEDGTLVSDNSTENNDEKKADQPQLYTIKLENFDKLNQKVFINDRNMTDDLSPFMTIEVKGSHHMFLRIETDGGYKHVVKKIDLDPTQKKYSFSVPSINRIPAQTYGYLKMSRPCFTGKMKFTVFEEDRDVELPLKRGSSIQLPSGSTLQVTFISDFQLDTGIEPKPLEITIEDSRYTDICDLDLSP